MKLTLFIAGDVVPKGIKPEVFCNNGEQIFAEMKPYITSADYSIVNLEAPVIKDVPTPIKKDGPCLGIADSAISVLKNAGFNIFTLANNHFFDQGQKGVESTINTCNENSIKVIGGGLTRTEARKPLFLERYGIRIAIINACEQEFSIANSEHGGSNPLDLINMQEDIAHVRSVANYVILIIHGGIEQYHYPTPRMKKLYRHFVDLGADAIINHHQHCINGYEIYKSKPIFYGLGNFYFPWGSKRPNSWQYGYAVMLDLDSHISFNLIPYKQALEGITLRDTEEFKIEIDPLCSCIADDSLLQSVFDSFIMNNEYYIKTQLFPSFLRNRLFIALANRGYLGSLFRGKQLFTFKNKINCESHLETVQRLFSILTKQ